MEPSTPITRRRLLKGAAGGALGGAATLAYASLPAWAKPVARAASLRQPGSVPFPSLPVGHPTPALEQIENIVVLMMENHSFDNLLGMVPHRVKGRRAVDGFRFGIHGKPVNWNPTTVSPSITGPNVYATLATSPCQVPSHPNQDWNASHLSWNNGANNGFVQACTDVAMWYWDDTYLPFTYSMAEYFPFGQRYFCSVLAQTYPNRRFLFCGTASGLTETNDFAYSVPAANGTIFNTLLEHNISWKNYVSPENGQLESSALIVPNFSNSPGCAKRVVAMSEFYADARAGTLPSFSFLDPNYNTISEENPQDIQAGEEYVAKVVNALMHSPQWPKTAFFLTWDEHGGYYDHVPPPPAIAPDNIAPNPEWAGSGYTLVPGDYSRYGFRVPLFVVSPWAKANYVSSVVQDHTSLLAFIERKWNLPALSMRDANAHPMTDYFDFKKPTYPEPPKLTAAPAMGPGLQQCAAAGLTTPPGTPGT